jgi:hypothetical protein
MGSTRPSEAGANATDRKLVVSATQMVVYSF